MLTSLVQWIKIAALVWGGALLIVLLAEFGVLQRLIPDWLRNLARVVLVVGTVAALTIAVLFGAQVMMNALETQAQAASGPALDLSFESGDAFLVSFYESLGFRLVARKTINWPKCGAMEMALMKHDCAACAGK